MKNTFLIILIFCASNLLAQERLNDYLQVAAENNPALKAKYDSYLATLQRVDQSKSLPDPTLSFGYFISPVETRVGAQQFKLSVSQMFPWMGTLKTQESLAAAQAKVQFEAFLEAKNQLFLEVKNAWIALYALEEEIKLSRANLGILKSYEPVTKTKYESDLVSLADLVRVQISIDDAQTKLKILEMKRAPLISSLNTLLNRPIDSEVNIGVLSQITTERQLLLDSALAQHPSVLEAQSRISVAETQIELSDLKRKPNIGVGLDYAFVSKRTDMAVPDNGKDILMPMVSVSLPIFGKKNRALKKEAILNKESAESNLIATQNNIKNSWEQTAFAVQKAQMETILFEKEIAQTNLLLNVLLSEYSNDSRNFEDLLATQLQLLQLQLAALSAEVNFYQAHFNKEYLTGNNLQDFISHENQ